MTDLSKITPDYSCGVVRRERAFEMALNAVVGMNMSSQSVDTHIAAAKKIEAYLYPDYISRADDDSLRL